MNRYGLCCISNILHEKGFSFHTITKTQYYKLSPEKRTQAVIDILVHNLKVTLMHMQMCVERGWVYRMSSSLCPLLNLAGTELTWDIAVKAVEVDVALIHIKNYLQETGLRVSLHPDQFVVPASNKSDVRAKSLAELENHSRYMDLLGIDASYNYPINIHMNSYLGYSLADIYDRFADVYKRMSKNLRSRLVLENEDKPNSWSVQELYDHLYTNLGIPITYDCLHHRCNSKGLDAFAAVELVKSTWGESRPLFHYSGADSESNNIRAHADYPTGIPLEFYHIDNVDLDVEFKMKDYAIVRIEQNYPQII